MNHFKMFIFIIQVSFHEEFYMNEEATNLVGLVRVYHAFEGLEKIVYFQNKIVGLEIIRTDQGKKIFMGLFVVELTVISFQSLVVQDLSDLD